MAPKFFIDFIEWRPKEGRIHIEGYSVGGGDFIARTSMGEYMLTASGARHMHDGQGHKTMVEVLYASVQIDSREDTIYIISRSTKQACVLITNQYTGLSKLWGSYRRRGDLLLRKKAKRIGIAYHSNYRALMSEGFYWLRLLCNWRVPAVKAALFSQRSSFPRRIAKAFFVWAEAVIMIPRGIGLRIAYRIAIRKKTKPLWLVSDRGMAAGDNGEALFEYIQSINDTHRDVYFVISKSSKDYERLSRHGKVLDTGSLSYKLKFLLADKIISSHADIEVTNPFLRQIDHFVDLFNFDFVFLQHGIIRNDLSDWLNKYEKNIRLFVTSAQKEYDSILRYPYYYTDREVVLSGMPRYDLLESRPQQKIIIAPTYRKNLLRLKTNKYGARGYDSNFKESGYCKFYNRLINDSRLHEAMKRTGMTGELYIHPNFAAQHQDFQANSHFTIAEYPYDYTHALQEGSLLVSDYSSVVLDFAYLKKPVIYTHFDKDSFFKTHTYNESEFFSDEDDGFGPVTDTYDELVDRMVEYLDNNCRMEGKYRDRVEKFFRWHDRDNSKRVYDAIVDVETKREAV